MTLIGHRLSHANTCSTLVSFLIRLFAHRLLNTSPLLFCFRRRSRWRVQTVAAVVRALRRQQHPTLSPTNTRHSTVSTSLRGAIHSPSQTAYPWTPTRSPKSSRLIRRKQSLPRVPHKNNFPSMSCYAFVASSSVCRRVNFITGPRLSRHLSQLIPQCFKSTFSSHLSRQLKTRLPSSTSVSCPSFRLITRLRKARRYRI